MAAKVRVPCLSLLGMNSSRVNIEDFFMVTAFDDRGCRFWAANQHVVPNPAMDFSDLPNTDVFIFELENDEAPFGEAEVDPSQPQPQHVHDLPAPAPAPALRQPISVLEHLNRMSLTLRRSFLVTLIKPDQIQVFYSHGFDGMRKELKQKMKQAQSRQRMVHGMVDVLSLSRFYAVQSEDDQGLFEDMLRMFHRDQLCQNKKIMIAATHTQALSPMLVFVSSEHARAFQNNRLCALRIRFGELSSLLSSA